MIGKRFEIGELLGEGGMGTVYRGVDRDTGQPVAVKRLKPEIALDPDFIARFAREADALRVLNHPNIVKVLATLQEDGQHYLVMEYVGGGSLYDLLQDVRTHHAVSLPVSRVLEIALDLSDALTRAHRLNIIHRDLKPANVLLADDGMPRLTDFGVARIGSENRVTETGATVGTLDYLSPEALNGVAADARTDIWAFGVMLYEMLAGIRPFAGDTLTHVVTAILTYPTPDLEECRPDAPVALVDLIYRMLEKDLSARIPSVRQVGAELEAILQGYDTKSGFVMKRGAADTSLFSTPTPTSDGPKHNLPAQTTPFVGREEELSAVAKLLNDPNLRLVTVLGPGGMGKTRLALEVAQHFINGRGDLIGRPYTPSGGEVEYLNGVYFVPLAPISAPEFIVPAIAESVRFSFYGADNPDQQLLDYLREKSMLLLMDNFEHVIAGATVVADILKTAPGVKILATSRERLNIQGETLFTIGGMDFPDWEAPEDTLEYSAVKLFLQSARRAQPGFELREEDLPPLARICKLVRGMPLGIELAAAWADSLRLDEIAAEIERSLDFLESEMRDVPERHRSIRAVFEYSWVLLADDEREVFTKLSVFRGGFTRDAAMAVAGASLRSLTGLVNKSLLSRNTDGRYQVHELLRQYAEERLKQSGQADAVYDAHCAYYADVFGTLFNDFSKMGDKEAIHQVETEFDNLRAAWRWVVEHARIKEANSLVLPLLIVYQVRSLFLEGAEAIDKAVQMLNRLEPSVEINEALMMALLSQSWFCIRLGEIDKAKTAAERSCDLMKIVPPRIGAEEPLSALGMVYSIMGDYPTAIRYAEEGLKFNLSRNDPGSAMLSYYVLTSAAFGKGDYQAAKQHSEKALACTEQVNQRWFAAYIHVDLGHIARVMGDYAEAKKHYQACYDIRKEFDDPEGMAVSLKNLGRVALLEGDADKAKSLYEESIAIYKDLGDRGGLATALAGLGMALGALGDYAGAQTHLRKALSITQAIRLTPLTLATLVGFGQLLLRNGQSERGLELLALVLNHPSSSHETKDEAKSLLDGHAHTGTAWERGKSLELDAVVRELLRG